MGDADVQGRALPSPVAPPPAQMANPLPAGASGALREGDFEIHDYTKPRPQSPACEKLMSVALYVALFAQLGVGCNALAAQNVIYASSDGCPDGWMDLAKGSEGSETSSCITEDLYKQIQNCQFRQGLVVADGARRLWEDLPDAERRLAISRRLQDDLPATLWNFVSREAGIVGAVFGGMVLIAAGWLYTFRKCAKMMVWGMAVVDVALLCVAKQYILAAIFILVCAWFREGITISAKIMQEAVKALEDNPSLWVHCTLIQAVFIGYAAFFVGTLAAAGSTMHVEEDSLGCSMHIAAFPYEFFTISFVLGSAFFANAKAIVTAVTVTHWYFPKAGQEDRNSIVEVGGESPGVVGMRWAFLDMAGANAICSVVVTAVATLRQQATSKGLCVLTCGVFLCLWKCLESMVQQFCRFALIGGVISGKPFLEAASWSYNVIIKHLGQGIIVGSVAANVMMMGTYILSVAFGVIAMSLACVSLDIEAALTGEVLQVFCICLAYLASMPFLMLILIAMFLGALEISAGGVAILFSVFVTSIAVIFFTFVSEFVLNSTDVIYMCFCLERCRGSGQYERFDSLYGMIKDHIADGDVKGNIQVGVAVGAAGHMGDAAEAISGV